MAGWEGVGDLVGVNEGLLLGSERARGVVGAVLVTARRMEVEERNRGW
jgi:hypothetical protein